MYTLVLRHPVLLTEFSVRSCNSVVQSLNLESGVEQNLDPGEDLMWPWRRAESRSRCVAEYRSQHGAEPGWTPDEQSSWVLMLSRLNTWYRVWSTVDLERCRNSDLEKNPIYLNDIHTAVVNDDNFLSILLIVVLLHLSHTIGRSSFNHIIFHLPAVEKRKDGLCDQMTVSAVFKIFRLRIYSLPAIVTSIKYVSL